jgi:hypothetical protein
MIQTPVNLNKLISIRQDQRQARGDAAETVFCACTCTQGLIGYNGVSTFHTDAEVGDQVGLVVVVAGGRCGTGGLNQIARHHRIGLRQSDCSALNKNRKTQLNQ